LTNESPFKETCGGRKKIKKITMTKLIYGLLLLTFSVGLIRCNAQKTKQDFIADYHIDKTVPVDSTTRTLLKIKQTGNWILSLEEKNNFELRGSGKSIVGFWNIEQVNDNEYRLLLQGGGWTLVGRFDGTTVYFEGPNKMFDSLFSQVTFTKKPKHSK